MLRYFKAILFLVAGLYATACTPQSTADMPLAHYKYPIQKVLGKQYSPGKHYALSIYDGGDGNKPQVTVKPSAKNQIGDKETVTDENLIFIDSRAYTYLAFYDDWSIQESVEAVFDEDGNLIKTVSILYNKNGVPVSKTETSAL